MNLFGDFVGLVGFSNYGWIIEPLSSAEQTYNQIKLYKLLVRLLHLFLLSGESIIVDSNPPHHVPLKKKKNPPHHVFCANVGFSDLSSVVDPYKLYNVDSDGCSCPILLTIS